ncbi:MAG: hypothetical protein BGO63_15620 [Candidatus Accumulibacter sp. 66-26]|nr:MAG: hypothetical protein BGO63_15620 [Candidatus Accumulibacter sp. 66-26]
MGRFHLLQGDQRTGLLFFPQLQEALGYAQVVLGMWARYCTYFINTVLTYRTVRLRIPKHVLWCGFHACFGFRRGGFAIPKSAFQSFFGIGYRIRLWKTRYSFASGYPLGEDLQPCGQSATAEERVFGDFPEGVQTYDPHRFGGMVECLTDQPEVIRVELHGFKGAQRLVMQHVEVAQNAAGRVASAPHQAEPPRQAQQGQGASNGFVGRQSAAGHRRQIGAKLLIGRKRRHAIVVQLQPEYLPRVAFQRGQSWVEKQPPGHALMAGSTE